MKRNETQRLVIILLLATGLLAPAFFFYRSSSRTGFATPAECVEAYGEALKGADVDGYLNCLGEPARGQAVSDAETLRRNGAGLVAWVQVGEPQVEGEAASVEVDEVRKDAIRRSRFRLDNVAVAVRVDDAPLVSMDRDETRRVLEQVGDLLERPTRLADMGNGFSCGLFFAGSCSARSSAGTCREGPRTASTTAKTASVARPATP